MSDDAGEQLRQIMRRYPTGVTVVTSLLGGKPAGGTMNSFTSVSLSPPLVGVFIVRESRTAQAVLETGRFIVNILKEGQDNYAVNFANDKSDDKFAGVAITEGEGGVPVLRDALGYLDCSLYEHHDIADHVLFVGRVEKAAVLNDEHALIYHQRDFKSTVKLY